MALWRTLGMVWARLVRVVQGLATLEAGTGSGGGRWATSQTCWLGLLLLLACCRLWGGNGALGLLTIDDNGQLTVVLEIS